MYIALIKAEAAQVKTCSVEPGSGASYSHWDDVPGAEVYIGFYQDPDYARVKAMAAEKANVPESSVRLIELVRNPG